MPEKKPARFNVQDIALQIVERSSDDNRVRAYLVMENRGPVSPGHQWRLYFSLGLMPIEGDVRRVLVDGRYGYLEPGATWPDIAPGAAFSVEIENWLLAGMPLRARQGFYMTVPEAGGERLLGTPTLLPPILVPPSPLERAWVSSISPSTDVAPQTPLHTFNRNRLLARDSSGSPSKTAPDKSTGTAAPLTIIPAVKQCVSAGESCQVSGFILIIHKASDTAAAAPLRTLLTDYNLLRDIDLQEHDPQEHDLQKNNPQENGCPLSVGLNPDLEPGTYRLDTTPEKVSIEGGDACAVYHATHTFRQLITRTNRGCRLNIAHIEDSPDFTHRALFLDIARHFQPLEQIRKTIEIMSAYKLNLLQLGISNDEGWRLEIPAVPELTRIGSRREHHVRESNGNIRALYPAWGDNHEPHRGFLTTDDFINLLQFAHQHHVEIVVEFNLPGHANALIRSLEGSELYQLIDPDDKSRYQSAQGYTHNVVNVCLPSTYKLAEVILTDIKMLYARAEVPFSTIHFGGDETPAGAWLGSPVCRASPWWNPKWDPDQPDDAEAATRALMRAHYQQITQVAEKVAPGIRTGFWHEMSPYADEPQKKGAQQYFNVWTTEAGNRDTHKVLPEDILNRKQQLVISNASFLYLDMPYELHEAEPGLPWAGYIDTARIYHFDPLACWSIPESSTPLVSGMQAQLWTETVFDAKLMDYYLYPRLLAVAERCWNRSPTDNWPGFASALGQRELDYLESKGVAFRVPPPGVRILTAESKAMTKTMTANLAFPGLLIRYTTDGTDPGIDAEIYTGPVNIEQASVVKLRTYTGSGRSSRMVSVQV